QEADAIKAKETAAAAEKAKADLAEKNRIAAETLKAKQEADAIKAKEVAAAAEKSKADLAEKNRIAAETLKAKQQEANAIKAKEVAAAAEKAKVAAAEKDKLAAEAAKNVPKDEIAKSIDVATKNIEADKSIQNNLLAKLSERVATKNNELQQMKEENDLREKGIVKNTPANFVDTAKEARELEALKSELDAMNLGLKQKIESIQKLYDERIKKGFAKTDPLNQTYLATIESLKKEQLEAELTNRKMLESLVDIKAKTEIEKQRRIKEARFDSSADKNKQDKQSLSDIINNTPLSSVPLTTKDFDFGNIASGVEIVKNSNSETKGYFLIIATHTTTDKRNEFIRKVVASGEKNVNFFRDKNSKYYIYTNKVDSIDEANSAVNQKENKPYNAKMTIVKVE
ncbi:MAG: hypothetical protein QG594_769, partial [Bacteroidota bacterium]|nr:hypothetical protein [Bacteroidota bacterium]